MEDCDDESRNPDLVLMDTLIEEITHSDEIGIRRQVLTANGLIHQDFYNVKYKPQCDENTIDVPLPKNTINGTILTGFEFKLVQRLAAPPVSRVYSRIGKKVEKVFTDLRPARLGIKKKNGAVRVVYKIGGREFQNVFISETFNDISPKKRPDKSKILQQICALIKSVDEDDLCTLFDEIKVTREKPQSPVDLC